VLGGAVAGTEDPQHHSACGHERALAGCSCLAHLASLLLLWPASADRRTTLSRTQEFSNSNARVL
jgi:hypothetical protein